MICSRWWPLSLCLCLFVALAACSGAKREDRPGVAAAEEALRNGSPALAAQIAKGMLARYPDDVPALLMQGDAETQLGQLTEAAASFQHALRQSPNTVRGKMGLGRLRLATDAAEAATLFEDTTRQEPRNVAAWSNLGIARDLLGQHQTAQDAYRQARTIDPRNIPAQVNLALSLAMSGNGAEALKLIAPLATEPAASPKVRHDYAIVLAMAGREAEAEQILRRDLSQREVRQILEALRDRRNNGL
jgi:Flp pilus assembly protein TadD